MKEQLEENYGDVKLNSVRNPDGKFVDTSVFREAGSTFMKLGYYTADPWGSPAWFDFWTEERRRCLEGYVVDGVMIPGEYYFYLNYCPIQKSEKTGNGIGQKISGFPDFWDGDYNYFWVREIARNGVLMNNPNYTDEEKEEIYNLEPKEREKKLVEILDGLHLMFKIVPSIEKDGIRVENLLGGKDVIVLKSRRKGFEQPNSEIVMTPDGPTTMGELKVGSEVLTPTGKAKILEYYSQGIKDVYEITLQDGRKVRAGLNHLWKIIEFRGTEKVVTTEFFLNKKLKRGAKGKEYYGYYLPQNREVQYSKKDLKIHPYVLGSLIGDGSLTKGSILFSTADNESLEKIKNLLGEDYEIHHKSGYQYSIVYTKCKSINPLGRELKRLGLRCNAKNKFIPEDYKYSSIEDRFELVRGLMDTDGTSSKNSSARFTNTSEQLVDDLAYILRSLGIRVKKSVVDTIKYNNSFTKSLCYLLNISTDKEIFSLKRKQENIRKKNYNTEKIAIISVVKLDYKEESSCILLDSKDHLYLTRDYIVTHNSFKNASVGVNNFFHRPGKYTMLMAYDKKYLYPKGIFGMSMSYINFVNEHTAWKAPSDYVRKQDHIRNSYKSYKNGVEVETGYMSEIQAITFKDNPQAGVGKDCFDIVGEEVGSWGVPGGLKETVASMLPSVTDGDLRTGMMTLFGTANDIEKGTVDFADMFENPESNTFLPFYDIWGDNPQKKEGFFFPVQLNLIGHYDKNGNSNIQSALEAELLERRKREIGGATSTQMLQRKREFPINSAEALTSIAHNSFPVAELKVQLEKVKSNGWQLTKGTPVQLYYDEGKISAKPILDKSVEPITSYKDLPLDLRGCPVIYEQPINDPPRGLYKIGYDPIDQESGTSLAGIIVYKSVHFGTITHDIIVAEYIGRYEDPDDIDRVAEMFADLYNTTIMHENMVTGVKNYFRRIKRLNLLAVQPDAVISKNVKNSKVARVYGCHMNVQMKDAGERYVKVWLLTVLDYDENGNPIRVIDKIYSIRLLEELISYNRKGNFDLVSSLFMCMFQVQEEQLGKVHDEKKINPKYEQLLKLTSNMYKKK